jgi:hypothetical protein
MGLNGPGMTRGFDGFGDDHTKQGDVHNYRHLTANGRNEPWKISVFLVPNNACIKIFSKWFVLPK